MSSVLIQPPDSFCRSGSDKAKCPTPFFACPSGRCIPMSWTCDKENDCENGADEAHCGEVAPPPRQPKEAPAGSFLKVRLFSSPPPVSVPPHPRQISSARPLSLSAPTTAASPSAGCATAPTTAATAATRTASAVSEGGKKTNKKRNTEENRKQCGVSRDALHEGGKYPFDCCCRDQNLQPRGVPVSWVPHVHPSALEVRRRQRLSRRRRRERESWLQ